MVICKSVSVFTDVILLISPFLLILSATTSKQNYIPISSPRGGCTSAQEKPEAVVRELEFDFLEIIINTRKYRPFRETTA